MTVVLLNADRPLIPLQVAVALARGEPAELGQSAPEALEALCSSTCLSTSAGSTWFFACSLAEAAPRLQAGEELINTTESCVDEAVDVMRRAVEVGQWERGQTHESLLPYLREESEEFCEAVTNGAPDDEVLKELGDVFLQVLFHAEIAARRGSFDLGDVAASFVEKMRSRSPYLFDGTSGPVPVEEQERYWAEGKARERRQAR